MKTIKYIAIFITFLLTTFVPMSCCAQKATKYTQFVDPLIGSGGHGHVFVGANVPFGMIQLGPSHITSGWDWSSGYHDSDSIILGFSHLHLSGTGIGELQDILFMPVNGCVTYGKGDMKDLNSSQYSLFKKVNQIVKPGYYKVKLDKSNIDVELTSTKRVGFHKYTFTNTNDARVIIDLADALNWDMVTKAFIEQNDETTISGYRYSSGWANDQKIYFVAKFSKPIKNMVVVDHDITVDDKSLKAVKYGFGDISFDLSSGNELLVKVAISPVSIENAKLNMNKELNHWNFDKVVEEADTEWNKELSKIDIKTKDTKIRKLFYTSLYHSMLAPMLYSDINGDYRGADKQIHNDKFNTYTTFSLWDTYRAAHPLMTIIHPELMEGITMSMLRIYQQQGKLPIWHLMSCETDCMVGSPGVSVLADAYLKGYIYSDSELIFNALKNSALRDERGLKELREYGYMPFDKVNEALSQGMEQAIADWSIAQVAKNMNKTDEYKYFNERSKSYRHYFDPSIGFMRGKDSAGNFRDSFNPFISVHRVNDYTEGNAWQYTWLVPHDIDGLINLFGGKENFTTKLDSLFIVEGDMGEHASVDITGLIGQYAHGNEPSHHIAYIYQYVDQPHKTANLVREILSLMYNDTTHGICGNEDAGQMSSWYVLSSMGLYQVEPAGGKYVFGSPIIDNAKINVGDGKVFEIVAHNNSSDNKYIEKVMLNGKAYDQWFIYFADIKAGGKLEFFMSNN